MKQAENIFIHYLTDQLSGILLGFRGKAKILWIIWGADLYKYLPLKLYDNHTLELLIKLESKIKSISKRFYYYFLYEIRKKVIKRIDYVISPHKGDVRLLKKYFKTKAEWYSQAIYPNMVEYEKIDKKLEKFSEKFIIRKNGGKLFLLGNSGAPTNNHLDIMVRLSKMKEQNFKIICPLSYGLPKYIEKIVEKGKMLFGCRFIPLLEFLDPYLYFFILKQIDLAVMYHNRQQGGGNVHLLAYLGKPICMKKTPTFFHLKELGIYIFSTQELEKLITDEIEFTPAMSRHNKEMALEYLSSLKLAISSMESLLYLLDHKNNG
jgi:hypothetical protein